MGLQDVEPRTVNDGRKAEADMPHLRGNTMRRNPHPACKPIRLTYHLATLIGPPQNYAPRRLFVPFAGVGGEVIGAALSGLWDEIVAVEGSQEYIDIAEKRIGFVRDNYFTMRSFAMARNPKLPDPAQLALWEE